MIKGEPKTKYVYNVFFGRTPFYSLTSFKASLMFVLKLLIEKRKYSFFTAWNEYSLESFLHRLLGLQNVLLYLSLIKRSYHNKVKIIFKNAEHYWDRQIHFF